MNIQTRSHRYLSSRHAILSTSREIFFRHGYVDASMDTIAQKSGISKTTLYAHFDSKEALFTQVVVDVVREHADDAAALLQGTEGTDIRQILFAMSTRVMTILMEPETIALVRLSVVEGSRMPRLFREAFASARMTLEHSLRRFFSEQAEAHGLHVDDPQRAAELFLTLTVRNFQLEAMMPWSAEVSVEDYRDNALVVADVIVGLYGKPPAAAP